MKKWLFALGAFALLLTMMLGGVLAADYNHSITLIPNTYGSAKMHLDEGEFIEIYAVSINGDDLELTIVGPSRNDVFSMAGFSVVNKTYIAPAAGEYEIRISNPDTSSNIIVRYTITRSYRGHFGIIRHQDIIISGSEF